MEKVTVKEDNTTIKFDLNTYMAKLRILPSPLGYRFCYEMEMDEIIAYLTENSYSDEIIERYEEIRNTPECGHTRISTEIRVSIAMQSHTT